MFTKCRIILGLWTTPVAFQPLLMPAVFFSSTWESDKIWFQGLIMSTWQGDAAIISYERERTIYNPSYLPSSKPPLFSYVIINWMGGLEGMSFFGGSWEINTHSFPHLHREPMVCGQEDRTTLWHAWFHVKATSKTPGQSSMALPFGSVLPAPTWELCRPFWYPGTPFS